MRRRAVAALPLALAACGQPSTTGGTPAVAPDAPLTAPARFLALAPADLPGFSVRDELAPPPRASGADDPYGHLGSYSVTYARGGVADEVTSSVNTYVGIEQARAAFGAWRAAVPRQYRAVTLSVGVDQADAAAYARDSDGSVLFGYRIRNVLGSLRAPAADVERLARLALSRCAKG